MFDAQLMQSPTSGGTTLFSPWFSREADNARFTAELVQLDSNSKLRVEVYHKNSDETGSGTAYSGTLIDLISAGTDSDEWTGLKELVRYKFTCSSSFPSTAAWILFRMLPPVWFDDVTA